MDGYSMAGRGVAPSIEIRAPAERVWQLIFDFAGWGRWNPLYIQTSGVLAVGNTICFTVAVPGMKPMKGNAEVVAVKPGEWLEYRNSTLGGLIRATRYIEIRQTAPGCCMVVNGEIMRGLLGSLLAPFLGSKVGQGLAAMNGELRKLAEASWQGKEGRD